MQTQLQKGSAAKRALARLFFAVGTAYIRARRVLDGVALRYAHTPPSWARVIAATLAAAVLYPLYRWAPRQSFAPGGCACETPSLCSVRAKAFEEAELCACKHASGE